MQKRARKRGRTAIEGAAESGKLDTLCLLLAHSDNESNSPPHRIQLIRATGIALYLGHVAVAEMLKAYMSWTTQDQKDLDAIDIRHDQDVVDEMTQELSPSEEAEWRGAADSESEYESESEAELEAVSVDNDPSEWSRTRWQAVFDSSSSQAESSAEHAVSNIGVDAAIINFKPSTEKQSATAIMLEHESEDMSEVFHAEPDSSFYQHMSIPAEPTPDWLDFLEENDAESLPDVGYYEDAFNISEGQPRLGYQDTNHSYENADRSTNSEPFAYSGITERVEAVEDTDLDLDLYLNL